MSKKNAIRCYAVVGAAVLAAAIILLAGMLYEQKKIDKALSEERQTFQKQAQEFQVQNQALQKENQEIQIENQKFQKENQALLQEIDDLRTAKNGVEEHGRLSVDGTQLVDQHGNPLMLRGMSSHGISWYPEYTNYAALKTIKDYGANAFRVVMYVEQNDAYLEEPALNQKLLFSAIENALAADLYTIVDWHVLRDENPNRHIEEAMRVLEEVAQRYGDHPGILYEICNEPNGDTSYEDIVHYAEKIIPVIRKHAPNAVILVGTPKFCTSLSEAIEDPIDERNIMYSYHYYAGIADGTFAIKQITRGREKGLPIFVSEWGVDGYDATEQDWEETRAFLDYLEKEKIGWINWSLSDKDEGYSMIRPDSGKLHGWDEKDMSESGRLVLEYLSPGKEAH